MRGLARSVSGWLYGAGWSTCPTCCTKPVSTQARHCTFLVWSLHKVRQFHIPYTENAYIMLVGYTKQRHVIRYIYCHLLGIHLRKTESFFRVKNGKLAFSFFATPLYTIVTGELFMSDCCPLWGRHFPGNKNMCVLCDMHTVSLRSCIWWCPTAHGTGMVHQGFFLDDSSQWNCRDRSEEVSRGKRNGSPSILSSTTQVGWGCPLLEHKENKSFPSRRAKRYFSVIHGVDLSFAKLESPGYFISAV